VLIESELSNIFVSVSTLINFFVLVTYILTSTFLLPAGVIEFTTYKGK